MSSSASDLKLDWATYQAAVYACRTWHYSRTIPVPPLLHIGVWEAGAFIGVVIFSRGASPNLMKPYGLKQTEGCELTRIALTSHVAPVSRIVRLAIAFLKRNSPGMRLIVSFADPHQGHVGGIYQAGNWLYAGETNPGKEYWQGDRRWHDRQVSKTGLKKQFGAVRLMPKHSECTIIDTPGKHRYLLPLDAPMRAQIESLRQPYPKRAKDQDALLPLRAGQ